MLTEVKLGSLTFRFNEDYVEIFTVDDWDKKPEGSYVGDITITSSEWEAFVQATTNLCKCGGSCGCARV